MLVRSRHWHQNADEFAHSSTRFMRAGAVILRSPAGSARWHPPPKPRSAQWIHVRHLRDNPLRFLWTQSDFPPIPGRLPSWLCRATASFLRPSPPLSQSFRRKLPQVGLQSVPFLCRFNSVQPGRTMHPAFTNDRIIVSDLSDVRDPKRFRAASVTTRRKRKARKNIHPSTSSECPAVTIGADVNFRTSLPYCLNRSRATTSEHLNARPSSRPPASRKTNTLPELPVFLWLNHCPSVKCRIGMPRIEPDMALGSYPRAQ